MKTKYYIAATTDEQERITSSSGAITREIIKYLFQSKDIDAVYTLKFDEAARQYIGYLYTSQEEYESQHIGSIYNQIDFFKHIEKIKSVRQAAVIVSSCQKKYIQNKYAHLLPHILFVGYVCGWSFEDDAVDHFKKVMGVPKTATATKFRGDTLKGNLVLQDTDNTTYSFPRKADIKNKKHFLADRTSFNKYYNQEKCLYCLDHINKTTEISIGDAWLPTIKDSRGTSIIAVRSNRFDTIIRKLHELNYISLKEAAESDMIQAQSKDIYYSTPEKKFLTYALKRGIIPKKLFDWIFTNDKEKESFVSSSVSIPFSEYVSIKKYYFIRKIKKKRIGKIIIYLEYYAKYYVLSPIKNWIKR